MSEQIVSPRVYLGVFALLLLLTALTVSSAAFDMGAMNTVVALTIAVVKAVLVVLFFMHVRYSPRLTWLIISGGIVWLVILISFTLSDPLTRGLLAAATP